MGTCLYTLGWGNPPASYSFSECLSLPGSSAHHLLLCYRPFSFLLNQSEGDGEDIYKTLRLVKVNLHKIKNTKAQPVVKSLQYKNQHWNNTKIGFKLCTKEYPNYLLILYLHSNVFREMTQ